jgi:hypothetical protein
MLADILLRIFHLFVPYLKTQRLKCTKLFGLKTWSLPLREEHRLRVFENGVVRRLLEPKREEVKGGWRKLHGEEIHNLYSSSDIIRVIKSRSMRVVGM